MSPNSTSVTDGPVIPAKERVRPRAVDYLWRPWYAKVWWAAIPIYWLPAGSAFGIGFLADFYTSGAGLYLNLVFLPVTALIVLGFGFARRWRESEAWGESYSIEHSRT